MAATDPATIIRLFGSKRVLFTVVAADIFRLSSALEGPVESLGKRIARHLVERGRRAPEASDEFQFLLRSATNPLAAEILSANLHADVIRPLAARMSGDQPDARAGLIAAYVLGFAIVQVAANPSPFGKAPHEATVALLGEAIQACLDFPGPAG